MLISLWVYLIAMFVVFYYKNYKQLSKKKFFSIKTLGIPIATILVIIIPLTVINFRGEKYLDDPKEVIERAEEVDNQLWVLDARKELLNQDSLNLDNHFEFIKLAAALGQKSELHDLKKRYNFFKASTDDYVSDIPYVMEGIMEYYLGKRINYSATFDKVKNDDLKYLNYGYGLVYYFEYDYAKAEDFFLKEIENEGCVDGAVWYLIDVYEYQKEKEKLRALAYNEKTYPHLNQNYKMGIYFEDGAWKSYFREVINRHRERLNFFGFFGALLASFVWIWYLRSLDVFEPEKWRNIIGLFILGACSVLLVYPFSDSIEYYFNFHFGNGWINDFLYSSITIGLVEELVKLIPWLLLLKFTNIINEPFDYILYASLSAAGFAFAENLIYFQEVDLNLIFIRATYCIVGHMFWSSIIAYGFILYKYKFKSNKRYWFIYPIVIIIAAASHGLYDFFLFYNISMISVVFFLGSLHLFVVFQNNALNISNHFSFQVQLNARKVGIQLIFGLLAIFMFQYVAIGWRYGDTYANKMIQYSALSVSFMLAYLIHTFTQLKINKGVWNKLRLPTWTAAGKSFLNGTIYKEPSEDDFSEVNENLIGMRLRFFAPKDNPYLGKQLPVSGRIVESCTVSNKKDWYIVELDAPISVNECLKNKIIIRHKNEGQALTMDKILIYLMMIPSEYELEKEVLLTRDLYFTGRVYSRPL